MVYVCTVSLFHDRCVFPSHRHTQVSVAAQDNTALVVGAVESALAAAAAAAAAVPAALDEKPHPCASETLTPMHPAAGWQSVSCLHVIDISLLHTVSTVTSFLSAYRAIPLGHPLFSRSFIPLFVCSINMNTPPPRSHCSSAAVGQLSCRRRAAAATCSTVRQPGTG